MNVCTCLPPVLCVVCRLCSSFASYQLCHPVIRRSDGTSFWSSIDLFATVILSLSAWVHILVIIWYLPAVIWSLMLSDIYHCCQQRRCCWSHRFISIMFMLTLISERDTGSDMMQDLTSNEDSNETYLAVWWLMMRPADTFVYTQCFVLLHICILVFQHQFYTLVVEQNLWAWRLLNCLQCVPLARAFVKAVLINQGQYR